MYSRERNTGSADRARCASRRRATTLIELLVVIALIGLLIGILLPSLKTARDAAAATVCRHNLQEVYRSLHMYRMENDGWLPTVVEAGARFGAMRRPTPWFLQLYRASLLPDPLVLVCPKDPYRYRMVPAGSRFEEKVRADYSSYGLSSFIMTAGNGALADLDRKRPTRPADTILAADIGPDRSTFRTQMAGAAGPLRNYSLLTWDDGFDPFSGRPVEPWLTTRHGDGIHVLTIGGGVRKARTKPLMREPVRRYYDHCAAGGCTFCNELRAFHYSFARDRLYWWTGPAPSTK